MLSKLLLVASAVGGLSAPVANYQHTTQEGNVNITYQYETNEVNSLDDVIEGNIYHFYVDALYEMNLEDLGSGYLMFYIVNGYCSFYTDSAYIDETIAPISLVPNSQCDFNFDDNAILSYDGRTGFSLDGYSSIYFENITTIDFDFDFVLIEMHDVSSNIADYISSSDYNVITNVQEVYHTGLFGNLADFLRYHIFGGIPHVNDITFDIAGNTTTMLDWLVITTSIAFAIVSLVLLFLFFKFIIKIFSNAFMLR